jgi:hypothetical protein
MLRHVGQSLYDAGIAGGPLSKSSIPHATINAWWSPFAATTAYGRWVGRAAGSSKGAALPGYPPTSEPTLTRYLVAKRGDTHGP